MTINYLIKKWEKWDFKETFLNFRYSLITNRKWTFINFYKKVLGLNRTQRKLRKFAKNNWLVKNEEWRLEKIWLKNFLTKKLTLVKLTNYY